MNLKPIAAGLAAAALALPAFAGDQTVTFAPLSSGSTSSFVASFNASSGTALDGGSDTITFAGLAAGTYNVSFALSAGFASLTSAVLNGNAVSLTSATSSAIFPSYSFSINNVSNPLTLVLNGSATAPWAYYAGSINVSAVPEPETYALMLAGLGAVLFIARRRRVS